MEQKISLKPLYVLTIFISIAAACLALGISVVTQFFILNVIPRLFLFTDIVFALIIGSIVLTISLINIWLIIFMGKRHESEHKSMRFRFLLSYILSSIPLLIGGVLMSLVGALITPKLGSFTTADLQPVIQNHIDTIVLVILFLCILLFSNTIIFLLLNYVVMLDTKTKLGLENAQLKIKNIEATYQQLKQQIHPHFLFNSLNTLNSLIKDNPKSAEVFLKRLSDFLRTSITFNKENIIELKDELKFCMDYLELQKVRFGEALQFEVNIPEKIKSGFVPVFSIQQLIENALKHNALTINSPLLIKVEYQNNRVIVSNKMNVKSRTEESTGIGLINLAERYKILSGDEVIIQTDNNYFSVSLKILSHEDSNH